jgi:hypothetical protein
MINVSSKITIDSGMIKRISKNQITALEKTAEALHTEVVQAQVMPRDTGTLQNEKTFVDYSQSGQGKAKIITEGPYARRLYFHPEYNFQKKENSYAMGKWYTAWLPGGEKQNFAVETFKTFVKRGMP